MAVNAYPQKLAKRFWLNLLDCCEIHFEKRWGDISNPEMTRLGETLFAGPLDILGKNRVKDEFVECRGVSLNEIHFKTLESKICPGLHFAGEILDIDGITGGFNFQSAWTCGWIAGGHMAEHKL